MRRRTSAALLLTLAGSSLLAACTSSTPTSAPTTMPPTSSLVASLAPWTLPVSVSRAVVLQQGSQLLVLGGLASGDTSSPAVWSVDPRTGMSSRASSLRLAVHDAAGALDGTRALVFGGGSYSTVAMVQAWSPGGTLVVGQLPQPRSDLAAAVLSGTTYLVGGFDGTAMAPAILATANGAQFTAVGQLAVPVRYPAVAAANGVLWVVGGQLGTSESSSVGGQSDAIQRFDPRTGRTSVVARLPEPLGHASAFVLGGELFVAGGRNGQVPTAQIWNIDTLSGATRAAGTLPGPRSDVGTAVVGDTAYMVGGEVSGPTAPLDTVVELTLAKSQR